MSLLAFVVPHLTLTRPRDDIWAVEIGDYDPTNVNAVRTQWHFRTKEAAENFIRFAAKW